MTWGPRLRREPIVDTCACGCGKTFIHTASGRPRKFFGDHRLVTVRANEKAKRRANTPDGYRQSLLAGLVL